ncbi:hypothetical protein [Roseovarius amoyensis]|uniref:hypothetical protein n=1 Tax=Roseovarius amoyensis TaxID=2211448 RepID=UPI000DBE4930|nr:hypothetical protein [Roseovarius amoyensis]
MTERTETLTRASTPVAVQDGSYVDWPAILAGAVVAAGIAFVFTTFGVALGLSQISPYEGDGSALAELLAVGSWMLWTTVSSFMAGGYIAGRMRRRVDAANADEIAVRDGIHGLAVWGVALLFGAIVLGATVQTAVQTTADTAATVTAGVLDEPVAGDTEPAVAAEGDAERVAPNVSEAEAEAAAETARKYSVISAFVVAASLMIAGAGAYWAAGTGGQHRDEGRVVARFGRWT